MDPITQQQALAAAGAGDEKLYVDDVFSTYLYEGTGASHTIENGADLAGEGGMVWIKQRNTSIEHYLFDTERGTGKSLSSDGTGAEYTASNLLTSFNSDGFTLGSSNFVNGTTSAPRNYCSWTFRKAPGFFDVVTYTGNGTSQNISHNLGSVPGMIIVKSLDSTYSWIVYHRSLSSSEFLRLEVNNAKATSTTVWNDTAPTATQFSVGNSSSTNAGDENFVAYLFAHDDQLFGTGSDESIIKCGSYTGTGTSGNVVSLGFEPQWVLIKRASSTDSWKLFDIMRGISTNGIDPELRPDVTNAENSATDWLDVTATGFTIKATSSSINASSNTYIYMAIRRPHKPPTAGTDVFSADDQSSGSGTGGASFSAPSFPIDLMIAKRASSNADWQWMDRLRGYDKSLKSNSSAAESTENYIAGFDQNSGYTVGSNGGVLNETDSVTWCFKRAAGVFDMVAYTGTGSATTIGHSLGAVPKMMIVKKRNSTESWSVYHEAYGNNKNIWLNDSGGGITNSRWNNTTPTDSVFSVGTDTGTNSSGSPYIAYLFGDVSGISKVGSYTGTGSDIYVDCGFTAGARFVLIKRYGASGDWYVWDTTRGIVAGNDPYLLFNSTAAGVTSTDYIDPLNAGFTVTSSAPDGLNASGGNYLFLAIA